MNWGIVEWSALIGVGLTILGSGLASYLGVVRSNIITKKDIENGFSKLTNVEKNTTQEIKELKERLNNKATRLEELEKMLYEYLKKAEAEIVYCKKETMQPIVDNVIKNQKLLYADLKEFRTEIKGSISDIVKGLNKHVDEDRNFQRELIDKLTKVSK